MLLQFKAIVPFSELPSPLTVRPALELSDIKLSLPFVIDESVTDDATPTSSTFPYTIIKSMLSDLTVNQEKMQKATEEGFLVALDLAENLVLEKIPFRSAHNIVGNLVQLSHNSKKLLSDLDLNEIENLGIKEIKPAKLFELIQKTTISSSLKQRKSKGSAGTSEQNRMIGQRTRKLASLKNSVKSQNDSVKKSLTLLEKRVKTLTK